MHFKCFPTHTTYPLQRFPGNKAWRPQGATTAAPGTWQQLNPLYFPGRGSSCEAEVPLPLACAGGAYAAGEGAALHLQASNPLFNATVSMEGEVEAAAAPLLALGQAAASRAALAGGPLFAATAAAEAAAAEHAAAAVQFQVQQLHQELAGLQQQLTVQAATVAALALAAAREAAGAEQRQARQREELAAKAALAGMREAAEATQARLAAAEAALTRAREEAASRRLVAAAAADMR